MAKRANKTFRINGRVIDRKTRQGVVGLRVEAWDKDLICDDLIGSTGTDEQGAFQIEFTESHFKELFLDRQPDLFFKVFRGEELTKSTEDSVLWNIAARNTEVVIEVAIPAAGKPEETFVVRGDVRDAYGSLLPGVVVKVFDKDLRSEQLLGEVMTNKAGEYEIHYSNQQFRRAEKAQADLVVRVFGRSAGAREQFTQTHWPPPIELAIYDKELVASDIVFNASPRQTIDMTVDIYRHYGVSEYERYLFTLRPLFELDKVALHDLTDEDIRFLNGETDIPFEHLDYLRLDAQWSLRYKLDPAVFYGLFRQKLPTNLRRLLSEKPSRLREALKASLTENIIPAALFARLKVILESLHSLAVDLALEPEADAEGAPTLGAILATAPLAPELQRRVVDFALQYEGGEDIWDALAEKGDLDVQTVQAARFAVETSALVLNHVPTLRAVQKLDAAQGWRAARDLARLAPADWERIAIDAAGDTPPPGFSDAKTFGAALADRVEQAFPTAVIGQRLGAHPEMGNPDVVTFLDENPDFNLLHTSIDSYLNNGAVLAKVKNAEALRAQLKSWQRVALIAPSTRRADTMLPLVQNGFTSTYAVLNVGAQHFTTTMTPIIGATATSEVLDKAYARGDLMNIATVQLRDAVADGMPVLPGLWLWSGPSTGEHSVVEIPTLARLFGSLNTCRCAHCGSMYSPAAYLVDILEYLKGTPGPTRPLEILFNRRPDIPHIDLNCANANTPVPYIDLVNEILEAAVVGAHSVDWTVYQTPAPEGETQAELEASLLAMPRHELADAYETLANRSYPWVLPFDPDEERVRGLVQHLGLDVAQLYRLFNRDDNQVARTELQLGIQEWTLLTSNTVAATKDVWGKPASDLADAGLFVKQSGLNPDELTALTKTWFLRREDGSASVELMLEEDGDACDIDDYVLRGLDAGVLDQIHRFLRLRRRLGWAIEDLDSLLEAFEHRTIGTDTPIDIAQAQRLAQNYGRSIRQLAVIRGKDLPQWLRVTEQETNIFAAFAGHDTAFADLNFRQCHELLERWLPFRNAGAELRELAYALLGRDQVPAAFAPDAIVLRDFLRQLHGLVQAERAAGGLLKDVPEDDGSRMEDPAKLSALLVENLASRLTWDASVGERLLGQLALGPDGSTVIENVRALVRAGSDTTLPAIEDIRRFIDVTVPVDGDHEPDEVSPESFQAAEHMLRRLDRVSRLIRELVFPDPSWMRLRRPGAGTDFWTSI